MKNILFLCSGNSARSPLAEALLNNKAKGQFQAFSAGLHPAGLINPFAAGLIREIGFPIEKLRSKRWTEFVGADAPSLDFVITLCKDLVHWTHPIWTGNPVLARWNIENPTGIIGTTQDKKYAFRRTLKQLDFYIDLFLQFPIQHFERQIVEQELNSFDALWKQSQRSPLT